MKRRTILWLTIVPVILASLAFSSFIFSGPSSSPGSEQFVQKVVVFALDNPVSSRLLRLPGVGKLTEGLVKLALAFNSPDFSQDPDFSPTLRWPGVEKGVERINQDANGDLEITWNPLTGTPSFVRGRIPLKYMGLESGATPTAMASSLKDRYADLFGIGTAGHDLNVIQDQIDAQGMRHVTLRQLYQGVEVYNAFVNVHVSTDGQEVVAISNGFVPGISLTDTQPRISRYQALATAEKALPNGVSLSGPKSVVFPFVTQANPGASAKLAWLVELRDDSIPARNLYVVDAIGGTILDVLELLHTEAGYSATAALQETTPQLRPTYNGAFLTDPELEDYKSMTVTQIRAFLATHVSYFRQPIQDVDGVTFDPPQVIAEAASQHRINPKVILATLQKETSGVTGPTRPSDTTLRFLMGCLAPNTAREQLACAAERFRAYHNQLTNDGSTVSGWKVGIPKTTQDGVIVVPATKAVAGQFTYTPHAGAQWGGNQPSVGGVYLFYDAWYQFGFGQKLISRKTSDANHGYTLPGKLVRSEGDRSIGDKDTDNAHDFAGWAYDYYYSTYGRNSYDNQGAPILSTAHYGPSYPNAFWNGQQMVYGDGFPVNDVVAHELTHAVTEHSANLEYEWQSGALNESFSDIFGAMVDRDDWLIGEDLPPHLLGGRPAIRDMSNPPRFGQPGHTRDWVKTCSDNQGVHTNSGITNKAYYNIATAITKDKVERIFYRTLTVYLHPASSLEDTRAAALQSAQDLYGQNGAEYAGIRDGFNAVGLDGQWQPPPNDCTCAVASSLAAESASSDPGDASSLETLTTLYKVRDQLLGRTAAGQYYRQLYEEHTGRVTYLLLLDSDLRSRGVQSLKEFNPGLRGLMNEQGDKVVVTEQMNRDVKSFLQRLAEVDRARGGGNLARVIEQEMARVDLDHLTNVTFNEAWAYINSRITVPSESGQTGGVSSPNRIGGASGNSDARDADLYPAVAYDAATHRYLAVWMTAQNAGSQSDGFDVYGRFLDQVGRPIGSEFRISDSNMAARSSLPSVAAGAGEFVVAWTARGQSCLIYTQRITDASFRLDRVLISGPGHRHSPSLAYDPLRMRYGLAFVEGDDYLPPNFFGAQTTSCGNNASSTSQIKATEFYFNGDNPVVSATANVSDGNGGAFRPGLAYSAGLAQYLIVWEDRRNASGQAYRFDVYSQRLGNDMKVIGDDVPLATGGDYSNFDTSATWTPRPTVAGGDSRFLAAWFTRERRDSAVVWSAMGVLVPPSGNPGKSFTVAQTSFARSHVGQSPTGSLTAAYSNSAHEYMVGLTNHVESLWGYFSLALVQRISSDGQLLTLDGAPRSEAGVGISVDYENDDQLAISIAVNPESRAVAADYLVLYGKHSRNAAVKDFDIWSVRIQAEAAQVPFLLYPTSTPGSFQVVPNLTPALSWQAVANATDYEVQLATNPSVVSAGGPYVTPTLTRRVGSATPALQLGVGDLQADTVYYWQVRALFGAASGLYNALTTAVGGSGVFRTPAAAPGGAVPVATALASLIGSGHLVLVTSFNYTTALSQAFVPNLPGNTLTDIRPNSVIFINLTQAHTVVVSGVSFPIRANTPTPVPVGANVTIAVLQ